MCECAWCAVGVMCLGCIVVACVDVLRCIRLIVACCLLVCDCVLC